MKNKNEAGFSLIELIICIVIIGILAAISIPSFIKSKIVAENRAAVGQLSAMRNAQLTFYAQSKRFARLDELNTIQSGNLGTTIDAQTIRRGAYVYTLTTADANLSDNYYIIALRDNDTPFTYRYTLDQSGTIDRIE